MTGEDPVSSGVILLAQMHTHSLSTHSQHRGRNLANSTECLKLPSTVSKLNSSDSVHVAAKLSRMKRVLLSAFQCAYFNVVHKRELLSCWHISSIC